MLRNIKIYPENNRVLSIFLESPLCSVVNGLVEGKYKGRKLAGV